MTDLLQRLTDAMTTRFVIDDAQALEDARTQTFSLLKAIDERRIAHGTILITCDSSLEYADGTIGIEKVAYVASIDIVAAHAHFCRFIGDDMPGSRASYSYCTTLEEIEAQIALEEGVLSFIEVSEKAALTEIALGLISNS